MKNILVAFFTLFSISLFAQSGGSGISKFNNLADLKAYAHLNKTSKDVSRNFFVISDSSMYVQKGVNIYRVSPIYSSTAPLVNDGIIYNGECTWVKPINTGTENETWNVSKSMWLPLNDIVLSDTTALKAYTGNALSVKVLGFSGDGDVFNYSATGTPDFGTKFTSANTGIWERAGVKEYYYAHWWGVESTKANNQAALESANAYAAANNKILYIKKAATPYLATPAITIADAESAIAQSVFRIVSNMHIESDGATIKVTDNHSTIASPKGYRLFSTNAAVKNVSLKGLILDMNGINNLVAATHLNLQGQPHFNVSGDNAKIDTCIIQDCSFINTGGVSCIVMGQSNTAGISLGNFWRVSNCQFLNNGINSHDHSSIYALANDVKCWNNLFLSPYKPSPTEDRGGRAAYEYHGANQEFYNNEIKDYARGVWFGSNLTDTCRNLKAYNNKIFVGNIGFEFFRETAAASYIQDVEIYNNQVTIDTINSNQTLKSGVIVSPLYKIEGIKIFNNTFLAAKTGHRRAMVAVAVNSRSLAGQVIDNVSVFNNKSEYMTFGFSVRTFGAALGKIVSNNNEWNNLKGYDLFTFPIAIAIDSRNGSIGHLDVSDNKSYNITNTAGAGLYVTGTAFDRLIVGKQDLVNVGTPYTEATFTHTVLERPFGQYNEKQRTLTANTVVTTEAYLHLCDNTIGSNFHTLPTAIGIRGARFVFKKTNATNLTQIAGNGAQTIDGAANFTLNSINDFGEFESDNANWRIINKGYGVAQPSTAAALPQGSATTIASATQTVTMSSAIPTGTDASRFDVVLQVGGNRQPQYPLSLDGTTGYTLSFSGSTVTVLFASAVAAGNILFVKMK